MSFISFSCHIAMTRISSTVLNESGESRHSCLVLDLREKTFGLPLLSMIFLIAVLYRVEVISL